MRVVLPRLANLHKVLPDVVAARLQEWLGFLVFQAVVRDVALLFHPAVEDRSSYAVLRASHRISGSMSWLV